MILAVELCKMYYHALAPFTKEYTRKNMSFYVLKVGLSRKEAQITQVPESKLLQEQKK